MGVGVGVDVVTIVVEVEAVVDIIGGGSEREERVWRD